MSEIRPLIPDDLDAFVDIAFNAYPGWRDPSKEEKERTREQLLKAHEQEPTITLYGCFRQGQLVGGMRLHDFGMNFLHQRIPAGGVGSVAVDLLRKKEHVAKEMIAYFLQHYREQGAPLAMLYPFRPDFYVKMGFGYGTKMDQYRFKPSALPKGPSKAHVRYLTETDRPALLACYNRFMDRTHGVIAKCEAELDRMMSSPTLRVVGYERDDQVQGYLTFTFEKGKSFLVNDLHVREFVYENPQALSELLTFLHTQADQIRHIILETQDEHFHHLLRDPRNNTDTIIPSAYHESNIQGIGIMYRVIDLPGMFERLQAHDFQGQTCRLQLTVEDSFVPQNAGDIQLWFEDGRLSPVTGASPEVAVRLDIAHFSSLLAGAINFRQLYGYGLAHISDSAYVGTIDRIFAVEKPVCTTPF